MDACEYSIERRDMRAGDRVEVALACRLSRLQQAPVTPQTGKEAHFEGSPRDGLDSFRVTMKRKGEPAFLDIPRPLRVVRGNGTAGTGAGCSDGATMADTTVAPSAAVMRAAASVAACMGAALSLPPSTSP